MIMEDLPMILAWRNHPDIRRFMFNQHVIEMDEHRNWFEKTLNDPTRRLLIVEDRNEPFGYVQFSNVVSGGVSDWGFYVRPDAPKGNGRKLGITALNYAFSILDLHKVCGQAIANNKASISFHLRLGFAEEGMLREHHCNNGEYHSLICFGLLKYEWQPSLNFQESIDDKNSNCW
ncbi:MAG: UDP-4-amino-4,6-dideoxy-N-acetyl-beta-L-altrosamine N-acetyltransferase [Gammaproteobacteria bacterium]|nr:UDP-4-amino-4,6-dideoxy-N-acetyl-beta-L-altrosamine N-acetyltransferase [Gammaproteobacteria bacterium]